MGEDRFGTKGPVHACVAGGYKKGDFSLPLGLGYAIINAFRLANALSAICN